MNYSNLNINPESLLKTTNNAWIYWKDAEGRYLGCNDLMAEMLKLNSRQDIVGRVDRHIAVIRNDETSFYNACDKLVMENGLPMQFMDSATLTDKKIHFLVLKMPLFCNNKKLFGIVGISHCLNEKDTSLIMPEENLFIHRELMTSNFSRRNTDHLNNNRNAVTLTDRQSECLSLVIRGKTAKQIAKILNLSPRTVEGFIGQLKDKFSCSAKSELIGKAIAEGYMDMVPSNPLIADYI